MTVFHSRAFEFKTACMTGDLPSAEDRRRIGNLLLKILSCAHTYFSCAPFFLTAAPNSDRQADFTLDTLDTWRQVSNLEASPRKACGFCEVGYEEELELLVEMSARSFDRRFMTTMTD